MIKCSVDDDIFERCEGTGIVAGTVRNVKVEKFAPLPQRCTPHFDLNRDSKSRFISDSSLHRGIRSKIGDPISNPNTPKILVCRSNRRNEKWWKLWKVFRVRDDSLWALGGIGGRYDRRGNVYETWSEKDVSRSSEVGGARSLIARKCLEELGSNLRQLGVSILPESNVKFYADDFSAVRECLRVQARCPELRWGPLKGDTSWFVRSSLN